MSAFHPYETKMTDATALCAALKKVSNYDAAVHETPQSLYGYRGDERPQKAEIIVHRGQIGGCSNDLGYKRQPDGTFSAIISDYDMRRHNQKWQEKVAQAYAEEKQMSVWKKAGYQEFEREEIKTSQGTRVVVRAKVPAAPAMQKVGFSR